MTTAARRPPVSDSAVASVAPADPSRLSASTASGSRDVRRLMSGEPRPGRLLFASVSRPIEDYAMIGDRHTAALVGTNGSIDWLCLPRFDSPACFAALLGDDEQRPLAAVPGRRLRGVAGATSSDSAALQTTFTTDTGVVTLLDVMPTGDDRIDLVRRVTGVRGTVRMHHEWVVRFDYGTARRRGSAVATRTPTSP